MSEINIKGLDKAKILKALYDRAHPLGLGFLHFVPGDMEIKEAEELVKKYTYFDYLKGRVMKVDLSKDELRTDLFDRDNGNGAAYNALKDAGLL